MCVFVDGRRARDRTSNGDCRKAGLAFWVPMWTPLWHRLRR